MSEDPEAGAGDACIWSTHRMHDTCVWRLGTSSIRVCACSLQPDSAEQDIVCCIK